MSEGVGTGSVAASTPTSTTTSSSTPAPQSSAQSQMTSQPSQTSSKNSSSSAGTGTQQPAAAAAPSELFEVKVNGRVTKMTREELIGHAQMSQAAQERFQEASRIKKQVDSLIQTAKSNPIEALMNPELGLSKDQIRDAFEKWYAKEYIEPETLSPQELQYKRAMEENQRYKQQEQEFQAKQQQEALEKMTVAQRDVIQQQIIDAMDKSGLPKTPFYAQRMAFYMLQNARNHFDAPVEMIVSQVKREERDRLQGITKDAPVEYLIETLGEDVINKIRKWDLERLRAKRNFQPAQGSYQEARSSQTQTSYQERPRMSSRDVDQRLRDIRLGKF